MWFFATITLGTQLFLAAVMFLLPSMERKGVLFGKRTSPTPLIQTMLARWRWNVALITLATVLGAILCYPKTYSIIFILAQPAALTIAWLITRARFSPVPPQPIDMNVREGHLKRPPDPTRALTHFLMLAPIIVIMLSIAILATLWDRIPERYPIHWNIRGEVDAWGSRSFHAFQMPVLAAIVWMFIYWMLKSGAFDYMPPRRKFGCTLAVAGVMWGIVLISIVMMPLINPKITLLICIFMPFIMLVLLIPLWMKFSPRLPEDPPATPAEIKRDDARFWHWGFYSNPDDPAPWVEKRFGVGSTPNMAHREGKIFIAVTLLFIVVTIGWAVWMTQ